jgi:MFS family permease
MARDLRLFYLFRLLATSYLYVPVFMAVMAARGLSFNEIMVLGAIYCGTVILIEIPTGAFADRIGRRQSMMLGAAMMVASSLIAYGADDFATFALVEVLAATSMALCSGADSAYLFDLLQEHGRADEYARREATASTWHQAGNAIAFAGGGLLAGVDLALPYLVTAVVAGAAFVVACVMGPDRTPARAHAPVTGGTLRGWGRHMKLALRDVRSNRRLAWLIAYSAVVFVLLRATIYLYQPYLDARHFSPAEIGFVFAAVYTVAAVVAHRSNSLRRWIGEEVLVWGLLGALAVTFVLLDQVPGAWALSILGVQAVANGLYSPLVKPMLNREIPDSSRRATVLSIESIARRGTMGVFSPIAGIYGATSAIYLCGAFGLIGLTVLLIFSASVPWARSAPSTPTVD